MIVFWIAAIVIFLIVEGLTAALTSIWFAIGSAAALISALFGAQLWLQIFWFVAVSVLVMWRARPLIIKSVNQSRQATNADRAIGKPANVVERIDNMAGTGSVKVEGRQWMARSATGEVCEVGSVVTVLRIEGAKLIVEKCQIEAVQNA